MNLFCLICYFEFYLQFKATDLRSPWSYISSLHVGCLVYSSEYSHILLFQLHRSLIFFISPKVPLFAVLFFSASCIQYFSIICSFLKCIQIEDLLTTFFLQIVFFVYYTYIAYVISIAKVIYNYTVSAKKVGCSMVYNYFWTAVIRSVCFPHCAANRTLDYVKCIWKCKGLWQVVWDTHYCCLSCQGGIFM